ncbi:MAG: AAA family ATPase [Actinomycetota bacterium]|nr:AAA family ATPase [Actinomycetota bacterium]
MSTNELAEPQSDSLLQGVVTAAELSHKVFPALVEFIAGIIVEGFGIVAGPPKLGKSWFTLVIALAVAAGGHAFGKLKCDARPVLLLALEDSERRLQTRIKAVYGSEIPPHRLHILTRIPPGLLIPTISAWLQVYPTGLVILDTLGRARQQRRPGTDAYLEDYKAGVELKNVVDAFPGSALLGVHHTRKASSGDFVDDLSGTLGLAGAADYVLVLRRPRQSNEATLQITGRDAPEGEYAFTVEGGRWILAGNGLAEAATTAQARRNERQLGDRTLDVLGIVDTRAANGELTCAADIAAKIGLSQTQARVYLNRLADTDRIVKTATGVYSSVTSVTSVTDSSGQGPPPDIGVTDVTDVTPLFNGAACNGCGRPLGATGKCVHCIAQKHNPVPPQTEEK